MNADPVTSQQAAGRVWLITGASSGLGRTITGATPSTLSALRAWLVSFFGEDLIAQIDALVADKHTGTGNIHAGTANELFDLLLALSTK